MWDPPRPGLEPVSPALAGRLPTTAPPGRPCPLYLSDNCRSRLTSEGIHKLPDTRQSVFGCQLSLEVVSECQMPNTWKLGGLWDDTAGGGSCGSYGKLSLVLCILVCNLGSICKLHMRAHAHTHTHTHTHTHNCWDFYWNCIESIKHLRRIYTFTISGFIHVMV